MAKESNYPEGRTYKDKAGDIIAKGFQIPEESQPHGEIGGHGVNIFTEEKYEEIMELISNTNWSLRRICAHVKVGIVTFLKWKRENEELRKRYEIAKEAQADLLAEETIEIADSSIPPNDMAAAQMMKLRVGARQWLAGKYKSQYANNSRIEQKVEVQHKIDKSDFKNLIEIAKEKSRQQRELQEKQKERNEDIEEAQIESEDVENEIDNEIDNDFNLDDVD